MTSVDLLHKLSGLMTNLSSDDLLIPLRINGVLVEQAYFGLYISGNGERYINLWTEDDQG